MQATALVFASSRSTIRFHVRVSVTAQLTRHEPTVPTDTRGAPNSYRSTPITTAAEEKNGKESELRRKALIRAAAVLPRELQSRGACDSLVTIYGEPLDQKMAQALVDVLLHPRGEVLPKVTEDTPDIEVSMHCDLFWRCAVAVALMPISALRSLARHHSDLIPHLAPETAPQPEQHQRLVESVLPRFAMVCTSPEERAAAAAHRKEAETLKQRREAERQAASEDGELV